MTSRLAKTIDRIAENVPLYGAIKGAYLDSISSKRADQFDTFIDEIAKYINADNFSAALLYIRAHANELWMAENIDKGFAAILGATDEVAKECIALLVADHINTKTTPDRVYKQFANLFSESDARTLKMMLAISQAFKEGGEQFSDIHDTTYVDSEMAFDLVAGEKSFRIAPWSNDQLFEETCEILSRGWFLAKPFGPPPVHPDKQVREIMHLYCIREYQIPLWKRLALYLEPIHDLK